MMDKYSGILCSLEKEGNSDIRHNIDEARGHDAKRNKPGAEGQIL